MRTGKRIKRRDILKYAMGTCPAVCGFPSIVRASALGKNGSIAPSNRVNVGCIGNGKMGTVDINGLSSQKDVHVAAICDVSKEQRLKAQTLLAKDYGNKDCKAYKDFREVMARDDIDAVSIAAQDHWHALIAVAGCEGGEGCLLSETTWNDTRGVSGRQGGRAQGRYYLPNRDATAFKPFLSAGV